MATAFAVMVFIARINRTLLQKNRQPALASDKQAIFDRFIPAEAGSRIVVAFGGGV